MNKLKLTLFIFAALAVTFCHNTKSAPEVPVARVKVATAQVDSIFSRINRATQIQVLNSAVIQPRVNGFLTAIHFDDGVPIRRGDVLFTIDPASFATSLYAARAALESAKAKELLAQRNYERAEPLARIRAISQSDLDQYRATYKSALASTKSAEENLRSAELEIGYTKIYAPCGGVVAKSSAVVGDYVGPATAQSELTSISQLDTIIVDIAIPSSQYLHFSDSDSFDNSSLLSQIELMLSDSSTYNHVGQYYYTVKDVPSASSSVVVVARFPNPDMLLKEGMFARVAANIGDKRACVAIPKVAVSELQGVNSVWVIRHDSTAQWRRVELGDTYNNLWEIKTGVQAGDHVVVSGAMKLHNGDKVAIIQ